MSSSQTSQFNLHLWDAEDTFLREEFNENTAILEESLNGLRTDTDTLLGDMTYFVTGSYTGTNTEDWHAISLGFQPKVLLLCMYAGQNTGSLNYCGPQLSTPDIPSAYMEITADGFQVKSPTNIASKYSPYRYVAWC